MTNNASTPAQRVFPIVSDTACKLKWGWSSLYFTTGHSASCHRTGFNELNETNFANFHNNATVVADRRAMLAGQWPVSSCTYCQRIEAAGGTSDRMFSTKEPNGYDTALDTNPTAVNVKPAVLEVFFSNLCNLGCVYCTPDLSTVINAENKKYGKFESGTVSLAPVALANADSLAEQFWKWFPDGFRSLERLHVLGGEPLLQPQLNQLLHAIEQNPNSDCVLNIVTNLTCSDAKLEQYIAAFRRLVVKRCVKRVDITVSIDCWGDAQEYVRFGLKLQQFESNMNRLLAEKWLYLTVNQTISVLTIRDMPVLLTKLAQWRQQRHIGHRFGTVTKVPYLEAGVLGNNYWTSDFEQILSMMPNDSDENNAAIQHMKGIAAQIAKAESSASMRADLFAFLNEKDRRRGTSWEKTFPWLKEFYVV